jgi:hypothetical protein
VTLDREDIEAVAKRVVDLLEERHTSVGLVDAKTLAQLLGVTPEWVRDHADELGALRLGDGPRARMKFDVAEARERIKSQFGRENPGDRPRPRPTSGKLPAMRPRRTRLSAR